LVARVARNLEPFNGYYERLIARGKSATKATCALAGKLAGICYHVIKDGVYKGVVKKAPHASPLTDLRESRIYGCQSCVPIYSLLS